MLEELYVPVLRVNWKQTNVFHHHRPWVCATSLEYPWSVTLNSHSIQTVLNQAHEQEKLMHRVLSLILCLVSMPRSCNLTVVIIKNLKFFTGEAAEGVAQW